MIQAIASKQHQPFLNHSFFKGYFKKQSKNMLSNIKFSKKKKITNCPLYKGKEGGGKGNRVNENEMH